MRALDVVPGGEGKWSDWAAEQIEALQPEQYREMVRREVER